MPYTEEQIEEFHNPYNLDNNAFTDGYVETDMETCVPVAVFYNEDNLANIGLNVNRIVDLGDYDAAVQQLDAGTKFAEAPTGDIYLSNVHGSDSGIDSGWLVGCVADVVQPYVPGQGAWRDNLSLIVVETSVPDDELNDFDKYHRACWNAMRRALKNFAE